MTVLVTKANSDYWYRIRVFSTMEDIQRFIKECKHPIIIERNSYTDDAIFDFWDGFKEEDIPLLEKAKLHITIYDSWVE